MSKFGRLMCLSLLPLLLTAAAHGAVTMTASLGLGGKAPATGWCPVLVDLRNDGEATRARLSIPAEGRDSASDSYKGHFGGTPLVHSRDLQLPACGSTRCFLYVPATNHTSVGLKVGSEAQTVPLSCRSQDYGTRTLVVIGGGPDRLLQELDGLPVRSPEEDAPAPNDLLLSIAQVPWTDLPDQWLGWSGISVVVLADRQWAQGPAEARQALLQWVRLGGTLIVPGGALPSAYAPDLREVLPLQADWLDPQGNLAAVGRWLGQTAPPPTVTLATGALRRESGTLCAAGDQPLVVMRPLGAGEVIMTTFDYAAPQVAEWTLRVDLWRRLIGSGDAAASQFGLRPRLTRYESMAGLERLAGAMPQARRLPWRGMVLYLLVYVALLGPVQLLLARRRGRQWSWLVTLGIIAFFTVNAFVVGTALRGRRVVIYRASVLVATPGETVANGEGAVGVFSPGRGSCSFTAQPAAVDWVAQDYLETSTVAHRLSQGSPWRFDAGPMAMWTLNIARLGFAADLGQGVEARAVWNGQSLQVRVSNGTGLTLRNCQVRADGRTASKDQPLTPGGSLELWHDHSAAPDTPERSPGSSAARDPATTSAGKPRDLAKEIMQLGRQFTGQTRDLNADNPVLLAFTDDPVAPLTPTDTRSQVKDVTVLRMPLRATLEQGKTVDIPAWLVGKRSLMADTDESRGRATRPPRRHLLEYRVPVGPLGGTPLSLSFVMPEQPGTAHGYPGPDDPTKLEATNVAAFNFRTGSWQALPRDLDRWRVPTPEQFLTREGRLQLSYRLPDQLPPQLRHGSQELNTTLELKAVVRAW